MKKTKIGMFTLTVLLFLLIVSGCALVSKLAILYTDEEYKFKFVAPKECEKYFNIEVAKTATNSSLKKYNLFAPLSDWGNSAWVYYEIYAQKDYDAFPSDEPPGKPDIMLTLDSGNLLVRWNPQDRPNNQPMECEFNKITAEKI